MDIGKGEVVELPPEVRDAWWEGTTRQWPFMAADMGIARDTLMAHYLSATTSPSPTATSSTRWSRSRRSSGFKRARAAAEASDVSGMDRVLPRHRRRHGQRARRHLRRARQAARAAASHPIAICAPGRRLRRAVVATTSGARAAKRCARRSASAGVDRQRGASPASASTRRARSSRSTPTIAR